MTTSATDIRYGRRGGYWVPDPRPRRRPAPPKHTPTCRHCTRPVPRWDAKKHPGIPVCCGRIECRAHLTWDTDRWVGQARLAQSRQRLGLPLTPLDHTALTKEPT